MKTEIVCGLPEERYHEHPALSSTGARRLLPPSTPAQFDWERRNPTEPTEAMVEGKAVHRLLLGTGSDIELADYPDFRSAEARAWRDDVKADGRVPMLKNGNQWATVQAMRDSLHAHPAFRNLFNPNRGDSEVSLFWTDPETGIDCRARFDFLPHAVDGRRLVIPDLKKSEDVDPAGFARHCARYGYPQQAAWYVDAAKALDLDPAPAFVFVAISPNPPYLPAIHELTPDDLAAGASRNAVARRIFARCTETGHWPGWERVNRIQMPTYWRIETEELTTGE